MIDFSSQTYDALLQAMLERIPDTYDKRDTAPIPTALGPAAYALEGFYLTLDQVQRQAFLQSATGQALDNLGVLAGLKRYAASAAVRLGLCNAPVPIGTRFSTIRGADSINFVVTAQDPQPNHYRLTAETPGTVGNDYSGALLPIQAVPGLTSAQLTDILVPGDDEESDDAFRARILSALNDQPFGGNLASYRHAILAMDGVGAVQVYPTWNGGGTVKCALLGADFLPASQHLLETVQAAVDPPVQGSGLGLAPIGACVTIAAPQAVTVNLSATLALAAGYSLQQVQGPIEAAVEEYLRTVRQGWDSDTGSAAVAYGADVYLARITAAMVGVAGVVNATDVTINERAEDLLLTQSGTLQQVPVMGTVTLRE